ncbi:MAG: hypothetical protein V1660_01525 [archaeon]
MFKIGYDQLLDKISKGAAISIEEVGRRIDAKRAKLSGLITKEGAAQIVAAELGVSFDRQRAKISELLTGMRKISVIGKVLDIYPVRTFKRNDMDNKVATLLIADETASVRVVLWDTNHIKLIENGGIKKGNVVEIKDAAVRTGELHLSNLSDIKSINKEMENVVIKAHIEESSIIDLQQNVNVMLRAFIVQAFEPKFIETCPECNLKLANDNGKFTCQTHGAVVPNYRSLMNVVLDDGTENIRAILFDEMVKKIFGIQDSMALKEVGFLAGKRDEILGKQMIFFGKARQNKFFGNTEFVVSDINELNVQELIQKMSK